MSAANRRQWQTVRDELYKKSDRDFEHAVAPYLEYLFPGIWGARRRGEIDASGIDLRTHTPEGDAFDVIVQCKGFEVPLAQREQAAQIEASTKSLRKSTYRPRRYILLYNRDLRDKEFREAALAAVAALQEKGIAASAELWNLDDLLKAVAAKLTAEIEETLRANSAALAEAHASAHFLAADTLEPIPLKRGEITFDARPMGKGVTIKQDPLERSKLRDVLAPAKQVRWSLVAGPFGIGKTKVALTAALDADRRVMLVRAADMTFPGGFGGKTGVMKSVLRAIHLQTALGNLIGPDAEASLAAVELASILEKPDAQYALVIDGLDENPLFADHGFLGDLGNVLGELRCPSILITRREHFDVLMGAFERLMAAAAESEAHGGKTTHRVGRHGRGKPIAYTELMPWLAEDGKALLEMAKRKIGADSAQYQRLTELGDRLTHVKQLEELAAHPLFMQMLIDLAVEDGPLPANEDDLIGAWAYAKILRDLRFHPEVVPRGIDPEGYVTRMFLLMQRVAKMMEETQARNAPAEAPVDSLSELEVEEIVRACFGEPLKIGHITLSSLIVPIGPRKQRAPSPLRLRFFHARIRQFFASPSALGA